MYCTVYYIVYSTQVHCTRAHPQISSLVNNLYLCSLVPCGYERDCTRCVASLGRRAYEYTRSRARTHTTQHCTKVREKMAPARTRDISILARFDCTHFSVSHRRCFFIEFSSFSPGIKYIHFHIRTNTEKLLSLHSADRRAISAFSPRALS